MKSDIVNAIQIDETAVDIEAIMRQIRAHLAQTRGGQASAPVEAPRFSILDREVYDELHEANQEFDKGHVAPYLTPTRLPLIGGLWQRLRAQMHALVTFYVNQAVDAQVRFNTRAIRVLNGIVHSIDMDQTAERVERLERRVQELEARLARLEGERR